MMDCLLSQDQPRDNHQGRKFLQIFVPACCLHERYTHYCYILLFLFVYALVLYHAYFSRKVSD